MCQRYQTLEDHEACYREMRRLDAEWEKRYYQKTEIRAVIQLKPKADVMLTIVDILHHPDGIVIYVE